MPSIGYHLISGLPRSGSTLLAALLRQNPTLHANITSPVGAMLNAMLGEMSAGSESAVFLNQAQREAILRGLFDQLLRSRSEPGRTVFDTNRMWTARRSELLAHAAPAGEGDLLRAAYPVDHRLASSG